MEDGDREVIDLYFNYYCDGSWIRFIGGPIYDEGKKRTRYFLPLQRYFQRLRALEAVRIVTRVVLVQVLVRSLLKF